MNVDAQTMRLGDRSAARRAKKDAPEAGRLERLRHGRRRVRRQLADHQRLPERRLRQRRCPGWPCDKTLDELRTAWVRETAPAKRKEALDRFQTRAFESVPYAYFGQYSPAYAARKSIKNLDKYWGIPTLWALDK